MGAIEHRQVVTAMGPVELAVGPGPGGRASARVVAAADPRLVEVMALGDSGGQAVQRVQAAVEAFAGWAGATSPAARQARPS